MKIHRHLVEAVTEILRDIFQEGYYADRALEFHFKKNKKWGARDRRFVAESVYEIVRWWRRLWFAIDQNPSTEKSELRKVVGAFLFIKNGQHPFQQEFEKLLGIQAINQITKRYTGSESQPAIYFSLPDWLYELGHSELKEKWQQTLKALNEPAKVVLRANRLKITPQELIVALAKEGVAAHTVADFPDAVVLNERSNVFRTQAFQNGFFEMQDAASQKVAEFLDPQPGERVIDACAGAGGKSLHIAARMKNKGRLMSLDVEDSKLSELRRRSTRAGVDIIECRVIESTKTFKRMAGTADRMLLDVPCSGSGVWKRNPDAKWKLTPEALDEVKKLQTEILWQYANAVKVGGTVVYATCSILPSENQDQVAKFLKEYKNWELQNEMTYRPELGYDGFFMARLKRLS